MATVPTLITPEVKLIDGKPITTSIAIANFFGKRHDDVLKKIKALECSPEFTARNFAASEYQDSTGRKLPCYAITKDGFVFLAMGFTGKKAAAFKEAYINAFNAMERQLQDKPVPPSLAEHNHSAELEKAIQRKATELAVANIDLIAEKLANWVDLTRGVQTPEQALERVNQYDPKKAEMVFIPQGILKGFAAHLGFISAGVDLCSQDVSNLEKALGRPLNSQEVQP